MKQIRLIVSKVLFTDTDEEIITEDLIQDLYSECAIHGDVLDQNYEVMEML